MSKIKKTGTENIEAKKISTESTKLQKKTEDAARAESDPLAPTVNAVALIGELPLMVLEMPVDPAKSSEEATKESPFPIAALHPVMRDIVEAVAKTYGVDPAMCALEALATLAGAIGNGAFVCDGVIGRKTNLNLYTIIGANTGSGKSSAQAIVAPLLQASRELEDHFAREEKPALMCELKLAKLRCNQIQKTLADVEDPDCFTGKEPEAKTLKDEWAKAELRIEEILPLVRRNPSRWTGNTTTPGLCEILARNGGSIFYFSAEAGQPLNFALGGSGGSSGDLDLLLSGYSSESYRENRISRGDQELVPNITLLWMAQPVLVRKLFGNPEALARGFPARCLVVLFERDQIPRDEGNAEPVPDESVQAWHELIRKALKLRDNAPLELQTTPEARQIFTDFHNEIVELQNSEFSDIAGQLSRWREQAIRIAGGLAVADHLSNADTQKTAIVDANQARRAIEIARWILDRGLALVRQARAERQLKDVSKLHSLIKKYGGKVKLKDLRDRHGYALDDVEALAVQFPHALEICELRKGEVGRKSRILIRPQ